MAKKALITGITGQDGSYLAEFLLEKDYEKADKLGKNYVGRKGNYGKGKAGGNIPSPAEYLYEPEL